MSIAKTTTQNDLRLLTFDDIKFHDRRSWSNVNQKVNCSCGRHQPIICVSFADLRLCWSNGVSYFIWDWRMIDETWTGFGVQYRDEACSCVSCEADVGFILVVLPDHYENGFGSRSSWTRRHGRCKVPRTIIGALDGSVTNFCSCCHTGVTT